ncbi:Ribonuclease G [Corynebacterium glaucum]|uniref:translation initiation factor IF-2 N-terminal domain-containing protein n=1 Tax=Corynebacterium glaucum TaxID=187491 RepID=UPI0031D9DCA5|nr:Ribonuclease G [Corynebacterium glaucum]
MAHTEDSTEQQQSDATKAPRKASRKAAKKTAKKTAKKASKKSVKKSTKAAAPNENAAKESTAPNPYADFDRSQLSDKMRVFQFAKALDLTSKDLILALSDLGVVKVAQSSLTRAEMEQLLDALAAKGDSPEPEAAPAEEKIRERIRKDVANEITQIERKVEAELTDREEDRDEDDVTDAEDDALTDPEDVDDAFDLLTDIEPEVTPAPVEENPAYAPIFKAPTRSKRRRASRPSDAEAADAANASDGAADATDTPDTADSAEVAGTANTVEAEASAPAETRSRKRRRGSRKSSETKVDTSDESANILGVEDTDDFVGAQNVVDVEELEEPKAIKGSSRLEAQRRRRTEKREEQRKRSRIVSQAEFLARRESVTRTMVVRERDRHDGPGRITQVGVLEDGLLVEHFVTSDQQASMIGNIYLGRVQNVLPSMEAAFIDIGQGRNGVLYAGEVDWKAAGLGGRSRRIEHALKSGDQVVVQVTKDPVGHKGARLTTQISLAGRFLVYVPGGRSAGISRKLPAPERKRLKEVLNNVVPGKGGAIIRTAAEGVPEDAIAADVNRLHTQWEAIQEHAEREKNSKGAKPVTLYEEPNLLIKVVRDLFNEDFAALIVDGKKPWNTVKAYVESVAPDLADRLEQFDRNDHGGKDAFEVYRVDEQIQKALSRSVWLPSGGSLIIDRTEAMTVIDVNTGKFTGSGGSLEETVTSNNLEAAEEIVRQIRLRDIGGIIIIDFIDMILPENQDLVLRRLKEALGRDRTRHQVSEVTSLGLVQMTRKRLGTGLLETFSEPCETCGGRGIVLAEDPVDHDAHDDHPRRGKDRDRRRPVGEHPAAKAMRTHSEEELDEIAGSVIADQGDDAGNGAGGDGEERETKRSRRRGRRGGSRGRGKQREADSTNVEATDAAEAEVSSDAAYAVEAAVAAAQVDSTEPVKAAESASQTYEEAVEEFESSPRRKRRTRGNSKSDYRPKPEDFVQPAEVEVEESEAVEEGVDKQKPATTRSGRGRRRASRRSTSTASQPKKQEAREGRVKAASKDSATQSRAGRGRRRASRKSS